MLFPIACTAFRFSYLYSTQRSNKRLDWDEMVTFLVRRGKNTWGTKNDLWTPGVIATARRLKEGHMCVVLLTANDLKSLREKHNAHLLDEIVMIQPFVAKNSYAGCGLFETEFVRKGHRGAQVPLATYELVHWPEVDIKWSEDFQPYAGKPESRSIGRWRENSSPKRVHGILHQMLAKTTKNIVEHVEREVIDFLLLEIIFDCGA